MDKVNHSIQLTLMMAFSDIIRGTSHSLSVKTVKDTGLSIVQNEVSEIIPDETVNDAWKSFQLFLPWAGVEMVTNSRASVDNKNGLAKPNEKVIIPASTVHEKLSESSQLPSKYFLDNYKGTIKKAPYHSDMRSFIGVNKTANKSIIQSSRWHISHRSCPS